MGDNAILNRGCLQKPKRQTHMANKAFYQPHIKCHYKNQAWIEREEADIDKKYNHSKSDTDIFLGKRQEQDSGVNGRCDGADRIGKGLEGYHRLTFIGNGQNSCHQVMIDKASPCD